MVLTIGVIAGILFLVSPVLVALAMSGQCGEFPSPPATDDAVALPADYARFLTPRNADAA
jgi:hypothetical protein